MVQRYLARITWQCQLTELAERSSFPPAPQGSRSIVLDEQGKSISSQMLADQLGRWRDEGVREIRFLLGPADGHSAETRDNADLLLSFGLLTWPHLLARAMLAEQLYRAFTILSGHPYHRE